HVWEFSIAVICACLLRPRLKDSGWSDDLVGGLLEPQAAPAPQKGGKGAQRHHQPAPAATASETTTTAMDYILPVANTLLLLLLVFVMDSALASLASQIAGSYETKGFFGMRLFLSFGIVLTISCFYYGRPIRYGLTIAAVLIIHGFYSARGEST